MCVCACYSVIPFYTNNYSIQFLLIYQFDRRHWDFRPSETSGDRAVTSLPLTFNNWGTNGATF